MTAFFHCILIFIGAGTLWDQNVQLIYYIYIYIYIYREREREREREEVTIDSLRRLASLVITIMRAHANVEILTRKRCSVERANASSTQEVLHYWRFVHPN